MTHVGPQGSIVEHVNLDGRLPTLHRPVLVAAYEGWNDAGEAASRAVEQIRSSLHATAFARIDGEEFFDFQIVRPRVAFGEGGHRELHWPRTRLSWAMLPGADRHVVLLDGVEPNLRWRSYTAAIVELCRRLGVEVAVTVGALQTDTPHTRPVPVTANSADPGLVARLALSPSTYEGPTGVVGVLHEALSSAGVPSVSLWAGVPHYLAGTAYLPAALRLADEVGRLVGADIPLAQLADEAAGQADDIAVLVAEDEDLAEYVAELEQRAFSEGGLPGSVSGEELAAELERFLRDRPEG